MEEKTKADTYQTSDIALASYLYCSGIHLIEIDRYNPRRCVFIFEFPRAELLTKWQEGKTNVNALAYYNAYQRLKAQIYRTDF